MVSWRFSNLGSLVSFAFRAHAVACWTFPYLGSPGGFAMQFRCEDTVMQFNFCFRASREGLGLCLISKVLRRSQFMLNLGISILILFRASRESFKFKFDH